MARYVIDTCSLIEMRRAYPIDIFPSAWQSITELAENKILISAEDVFEELNSFDDEVLKWAKSQATIFHPLTHDIQKQASIILATHPNILDLKKNKSSADPFIIATAMHNSCAVVTEEKPSNSPLRVKIPDVCKYYGVECLKLVDMFRKEGIKF